MNSKFEFWGRIPNLKRKGLLSFKGVHSLQGVFPEMSYFGVKHSHLGPFLSQKTLFLVVFGSKHAILGRFGSEKVNFGHFSHF